MLPSLHLSGTWEKLTSFEISFTSRANVARGMQWAVRERFFLLAMACAAGI
jgi:hypothetical protein